MENGKYHGQETLTFRDGDKYVGEFKDGKEHGHGTYTWSDGRKYVGEFKDGEIWNGTLYDKNGNIIVKFVNGKEIKPGKYEGERKDGKPNGQGTHTWSDGRKYEGEFKDGKSHGRGTITHPDGTGYVGEWKDGKQHGQGTTTYIHGQKFVGEWKDGKTWNVTQTDKEGKVIGKWLNGVKQQ